MHEYWMQMALEEAEKARILGEVPVGAVLVSDGTLIARGHNESIMRHDPSAHAEILVLRRAGERLKNYRLIHTCLYVTLEPCAMCTGALVHARVQTVMYATPDPKTGACGSVLSLHAHDKFNHRIQVYSGLLAEPASILLKDFFREKR
jgi:tRNA(adenine34) deaminase